ncbi:MAG: 30S ribosomal protein S20 [bacterium]|nr:30S ribosomal protein S20 [bacterium]
MPVKDSAKKALRQSVKRQSRNRAQKRNFRTLSKDSVTAIQSNEPEAADKVKATSKALDKAVQKGAIHKKTASRKKSRLVRKLNAISSDKK